MRLVEMTIKVPLPWLIERMVVFLVLLYRRVRYGYAFRRIKLTRGKYTLVDPEDFERLNQYKWYCTHNGYAKRTVPKRLVKGKQKYALMHRELCPVSDGMVIDHINRNPSDNRKANLRPATRQQNCWNVDYKRRPRRSRYIGIYFDKRIGKWRVHMQLDGRFRFFGHYADDVEAAKKYDEVAKKYRGEFAVLNFPET